MSAAVGGNYVNRFNIDGRSYKVIPQIERSERLNADQLQNIYVTGPAGKLVPLSTLATIENSTVPRSLNRFQQLNSVKISGVALRPLDEALTYMEDTAAQILPKGYKIDYTGQSANSASKATNSSQPLSSPSSSYSSCLPRSLIPSATPSSSSPAPCPSPCLARSSSPS